MYVNKKIRAVVLFVYLCKKLTSGFNDLDFLFTGTMEDGEQLSPI